MTALPILLSDGFSPLVHVSETVAKNQPIAERSLLQEITIPVAALLGVPVRSVKKMLQKSPGETINAGDILARKKNNLGIKQEVLRSTIPGIISRFDRTTGEIILLKQQSEQKESMSGYSQKDEEKETVLSPIDGVVTMCDNEKIVLETDKNVLSASVGSGTTAEGELFVIPAREKKEVQPHELNTLIRNKVLLGDIFSREVLLKAMGMEAAAVIGTEVAEEDLAYIQERNIKTPVFVIGEEQKTALAKWVGKKIFLDGATKSILLIS